MRLLLSRSSIILLLTFALAGVRVAQAGLYYQALALQRLGVSRNDALTF